MTTVLSEKGQLVLPVLVRRKLALEPGDDFDVFVDEDDSIVLRRISRPCNAGLVDLLSNCPVPLEIPDRAKDFPRPVDL